MSEAGDISTTAAATFSRVWPTGKSEDVVRQIMEAVIDGRLKSGDRLPSVRQLQEIFGVSRGTIMGAIKALESVGMLEVKRGATGGTFVKAAAYSLLRDALQLSVELHQVSVSELAEFRETVEGRAAFDAARRCPAKTLEQLERAVETARAIVLRGSAADSVEFATAEINCHISLAHASGNRLTEAVVAALQPAISDEHFSIPHDHQIAMVEDWDRMVQFVKSGDSSGARRTMQGHLWHYARVAEHANTDDDAKVGTARARKHT